MGEEAIRVLIADDIRELRELVRFGIEEDPWMRVVAEAGDGRAAIEGVEEAAPHAVILDLSMPDMDGFQAIYEIRSRSAETVIIVLSGFPAGRMRARAIERGADAYVEKGGSIADLRELITRLVGERREAAARRAA